MNNQLTRNKIYNLFVLTALFCLLIGFAVVCSSDAVSAQKRYKPISKAALLKAASENQKLKVGIFEFARIVKKKGVDFRLTPAVENELRAAKLHSQVIDAVRNSYRGGTATTTTTSTAGSGMMRNTSPVASNRTTRNTGSTTNPAPAEDSDERYDALYNEALNTAYQLVAPGMNQQQATPIIEKAHRLASSAIKLDSDRPEGHKVFAFVAFLTQNYSAAEKYCQDVIDRDGSVQFNVLHYHGNTPVPELLYISNESVSIEAANGEFNVFQYSEIRSVQTKGTINFGQGTAAVFSMNGFKNNNAYETFFIPSFRGTTQDAQLITRIIARNLNR